MIARVWRGHAKREHADAYEAMLKPELLPGPRSGGNTYRATTQRRGATRLWG